MICPSNFEDVLKNDINEDEDVDLYYVPTVKKIRELETSKINNEQRSSHNAFITSVMNNNKEDILQETTHMVNMLSESAIPNTTNTTISTALCNCVKDTTIRQTSDIFGFSPVKNPAYYRYNKLLFDYFEKKQRVSFQRQTNIVFL